MKTRTRKALMITMPVELHERLGELAKQSLCSKSDIVRQLILGAIQQRSLSRSEFPMAGTQVDSVLGLGQVEKRITGETDLQRMAKKISLALDISQNDVYMTIKRAFPVSLKQLTNVLERKGLTNEHTISEAWDIIRRRAGKAGSENVGMALVEREGANAADGREHLPSATTIPTQAEDAAQHGQSGLTGLTPDTLELREPTTPYGDEGPAELETPIAVSAPGPLAGETRRGALKTPEWIKVHIGALDFIKPIEMPELYTLVRGLDVPALLKRQRDGCRGVFRPGEPARIELDPRIFKDPRTATAVFAHEIGHLADWMDDKNLKRGNLVGRIRSLNKFMRGQFEPRGPTNKDMREELLAVTKWWRPWDDNAPEWYHKYRKSSAELYADALSVMLNAPQELKARAPVFFAEFFRGLDSKPQMKAEFMQLWDKLNRPYLDLMGQRAADYRDMAVKGEELLLRKAEERRLQHTGFRGFRDRFMRDYFDKFQLAITKIDQARAAGAPWGKEKPGPSSKVEAAKRAVVPWHKDPRFVFDEFPLGINHNYRFMQALHKNVEAPLEAAGLDKRLLGEYLFFNRILNERLEILDDDGAVVDVGGRSTIANPLGITPEVARKQLLNLRLGMSMSQQAPGGQGLSGLEAWTVLEDAARQFQDGVFRVMQLAHKSGIISTEQLAKIEANKYNYATFASLDHIAKGDRIPAGIREQHGMLEDSIDPYTATVIKVNSMLKWIQHNDLKRALIDNVLTQEPFVTEAPLASLRWSGSRLEPVRPSAGKKQISLMRDGRPEWRNVDPSIAEMLDTFSVAQMDAGVQVLQHGFKALVYPLIVTYSPGFALYNNVFRDMSRTVRNMRALGVTRPLSRMLSVREGVKAWRTATRTLKGQADPLVAQMLDNFAMPSPFMNFTRYLPADDYVTKMLQDYNLLAGPSDMPFLEYLEKHWAGRRPAAVLRKIAYIGAHMELFTKLRGYKVLRDVLRYTPQDAAFVTRNYIGTPAFYRQGRNAPTHGTLAPFWNVFMRGWEADLQLMTRPQTRGAWWLHYASTEGLYTVLMALGSLGYMGKTIKDGIEGQSNYSKTNKILIPLGTLPGGEFGRKSVCLVFPRPETTRLPSALLYRIIVGCLGDESQNAWRQWRSLFSTVSGDLPSVHPWFNVGRAWVEFMEDTNPRDYRDSPILTNDEWLRGGWPAIKAMLRWTKDELGVRSLVPSPGETHSTLEFIVKSTPLLNSMIKISDTGFREQQRDLDRAYARDMAKLRSYLPKPVQETLSEYYRLRQVREQHRSPEQQTRVDELSDWFASEFAPAWEEMLDYHERNDIRRVKGIASRIME